VSVPVAVTGLGVLSAFGHGVDPYWAALVAGESGLAPIRRFTVPPGAGPAAEVPAVETRAHVRSPLGRRIDHVSLFALAACRLALLDAGLDPTDLPLGRTGLALGSEFGNLDETTTFLDRLFAHGAANPLLFPNLVMNAPLSYTTIELGLTGPSAMLSAGEVSGEAAVACGAELVSEGGADVCLAGGADELGEVLHQVFHEACLLSSTPRPLDPYADGFALGEGAAVLVLEPLARARARGARVYARLVPVAGFALPAPVHGWPRDSSPLAARLAPLVADTDAVVAAASGEPELDALEAAALAAALAGRKALVTAPRAATGSFGAAGALAAATAVLAVAHDLVPPTLGHVPPGRHGLGVIAGRARAADIRVAVVDGLARGGACRLLRFEAP